MFAKDKITQPSLEGNLEMSGYFRHFGLCQDPFGIDERESSFYLLPGWEQQIDLLVHYIRQENALLVLTGVKGVGKTTLVNFFLLEAIHGFAPTETAVQSDLESGEFLIQLGDNLRTCQLVADNVLTPEQILEVIGGAFDVATEDFSGTFKEQSDLLLESLQQCEQNCVLLIDNASELPDPTLDLLLYMISQQSDVQHRLHVVLIGQSDLKKRLSKITKSKNYDNLTYSLALEPMTLSQTEYYMKHRFLAAGLQGELPVSPAVINKIYKLSGGVPRMINQLSRQWLFDMLRKKNVSFLGAMFKPYKKTLIGGSFLLASFAVILTYLGQDVGEKKVPSIPVASHSVIIRNEMMQQLPVKLAPPIKPVLISPQPVLLQNQITPIAKSVEQPVQVVPVAPKVEPVKPVLAPSQPVLLERPVTIVAAPKPLEQPVQVSPVVPKLHIEAKKEAQAPLKVQSLPAQIPILPPKQSTFEKNLLIDPDSANVSENVGTAVPLLPSVKKPTKASSSSLGDNKSIAVLKADNKSAVNAKVVKEDSHPGNYTRRLMAMNPSHYTLKLSDMPSEAAAKAFIAKNKLGKNAMYYQDENDHQYILIYGEYADLETANRMISLLPKTLKRFDPIAYKIKLIQQAMGY